VPNWSDVLVEIRTRQLQKQSEGIGVVDAVRREYLRKLHDLTGRNIIALYSGWLSKPDIRNVGICDEDKNGLMMAVHKLDVSKGLDLILHTPGGDIAATESLVHYLQSKFGHNIRSIVPQLAMSAGTMVACSTKEILMARHSNLGPIDPQLGGLPAHGVISEFKRALKESKTDPGSIVVWHPILSQFRPGFLSQCENAIKWSNRFVQLQLETVMFEGRPDAKKRAKAIVKTLSDFDGNKTHSRHIPFEECKAIGLNVSLIEDNALLQDLVLTVHHCYMHCLMNTPSFRMIENQNGAAFVKQAA
jgi:hypothetical protein